MAPQAGMAGPYGPSAGGRGRALPIAVACGLAIGVFAGLVVVGGTGDSEEDSAQASPPAAGVAAVSRDAGPASSPGAPPEPGGAPPAPSIAGSQPVPAAPAGAPPAAAAGKAVVSFDVHPRRAHVLVNGAELAGSSTDVPLVAGSATIEVVVRARGHKTHTKTYTVTGDQTIEVSLHRDRREGSGPGSLLDIR
jgi:hypothetical protein